MPSQGRRKSAWEYQKEDAFHTDGKRYMTTHPRARLDPKLEARAVTLYVFGISEHTRITHVLFVIARVLFPLCHVIKSSDKLFASNSLNDLFAAVTDNFNRFDSRVRRGFN